ncbi:DUF3289 family protein, partial [Escherichia sp. HC-CC]
SLLSFQNYAIGWSATIHFVAQDHFGLDVTDINDIPGMPTTFW